MHVFNILNQVFQAAPVDDDEVGPARLAELKVEFVKRKDNKMNDQKIKDKKIKDKNKKTLLKKGIISLEFLLDPFLGSSL